MLFRIDTVKTAELSVQKDSYELCGNFYARVTCFILVDLFFSPYARAYFTCFVRIFFDFSLFSPYVRAYPACFVRIFFDFFLFSPYVRAHSAYFVRIFSTFSCFLRTLVHIPPVSYGEKQHIIH